MNVKVPPSAGALGLSISIVNHVFPALSVGHAATVNPSGLLKLPITTDPGINVPPVISSLNEIQVVAAETYHLISYSISPVALKVASLINVFAITHDPDRFSGSCGSYKVYTRSYHSSQSNSHASIAGRQSTFGIGV